MAPTPRLDPPVETPTQTAIPPTPTRNDGIAARVNNEIITWKDVLETLKDLKPGEVEPDVKRSSLRQLAEERMFMQAAKANNLSISEQEFEDAQRRDIKMYGSEDEWEKVTRLQYGTKTAYREKRRKELLIYKLFRHHSLEHAYDFERHVALGEALEAKGRLPVTFMLLPPASWHPDVWTDITRMRTLNGAQAAKGKEMHLCPLQFDIVDRLIVQFSNEGDVIFDPFAGLGTVPMCAIKLGRRGLGIELNAAYYTDSVAYCEAAEHQVATPSLFDTIDPHEPAEATA